MKLKTEKELLVNKSTQASLWLAPVQIIASTQCMWGHSAKSGRVGVTAASSTSNKWEQVTGWELQPNIRNDFYVHNIARETNTLTLHQIQKKLYNKGITKQYKHQDTIPHFHPRRPSITVDQVVADSGAVSHTLPGSATASLTPAVTSHTWWIF